MTESREAGIEQIQENEHIVRGLRDLTSVLSPQDYRVFGSLVPNSIDGPRKRLGDIDVFATDDNLKKVADFFISNGYTKYASRPRVAEDLLVGFRKGDTQVQIEFGRLTDKGWEVDLGGGFRLFLARPEWDDSIELTFEGVRFSAINPVLAYYLLLNLEDNPSPYMPERGSRSLDLSILEDYMRNTVGSYERLERIKKEKPGIWFYGLYIPTNIVFAAIAAASPFLAKGEKKRNS